MKFLQLTLLAAFLALPVMAHAEHKDGHDGPPPAEKQEPMKMRLDTDGDGAVTKAEFMKAQEERFADMDADGSGSVSAEEMKASWDRWKTRRNELREKAKDKAPPPAEKPAE